VNIGATSQIPCERAPMLTAASTAPPHKSRSPARASARVLTGACARCSTHAPTSNACAASASSSPGTSLIGREDVNQNSGATMASAVAASTRPSRPASTRALNPRPSSRLNNTKSGTTDKAPKSALTIASARASVAVPGGVPHAAAIGRATTPRAMITG
jgi:hypothetical protein